MFVVNHKLDIGVYSLILFFKIVRIFNEVIVLSKSIIIFLINLSQKPTRECAVFNFISDH